MPSSARPRRKPPGEFAALIFVIVSVLIFLGCAAWFWFQAPDIVASHSDASGQTDGWAPKAETLAWLVPIGAGIPLLFSIRWIWEKLPPSLISAPSKDYWLEHGERTYLYDCLMEFLRIVGGAMALLFTATLVMIMRESQGSEMSAVMTFLPTVIFMIICGALVWHLNRRLTPPR